MIEEEKEFWIGKISSRHAIEGADFRVDIPLHLFIKESHLTKRRIISQNNSNAFQVLQHYLVYTYLNLISNIDE